MLSFILMQNFGDAHSRLTVQTLPTYPWGRSITSLLMVVIPRFQLALVLGDSQGGEPMVSEGPFLAGPWVMRLSCVVGHLCVPDFELSS